jgi:type IV pilus assembly protein PilC
MRFNFQARSKTGEIQTGVVEASSQDAAFSVLKSHNLYVTSLEEIVTPVYAKRIRIFERVTNKDIVIFSRQLAIMFKSRVPIVEIFHTIARQTKNQTFRETIMKIAEEIEGGTSLSGALSLYPKLFSTFYVSMVKSGEASGKLTDVFLYLADYLEREYGLRSKIRGAMTYPAFIILVFIIVLTIIVTFVIPQLTMVLEETKQELPLITKVVMGLVAFFRSWWWAILLVTVSIAVIVYRYAKTPSGKKFFDHYSFDVPLLGPFLRKLYLSRFALNLSTLISGGLPIVQALEITGEVVGSDIYKGIILQTKEEVKKGEAISTTLQQYPKYIAPLFYQMVVVGEKTGSLDSSLQNVVEFYQRDVDAALNDLIKLLEPILIIALAVVVGGLMAAVIMPIYSIGIE